MSVQFDAQIAQTGTRFKVFPQPRFLEAFNEPETIIISVPPSLMHPGPADSRMFVVDARNKQPYSEFFRPPYQGSALPPVTAGPDGHFDHLESDSREFSCAMMYASVRRVLDIMESYFGHEISWHFESDFARLELIPLIEWPNAQSGYGFLEFGYGRKANGGIDHTRPFCQNFDVLAHEVGHSIIFSTVGMPATDAALTADYGGMHESAGDLVAILAVLHFHTVVDHLLKSTSGNLFTVNELDRVAELSASREIRIAFNYDRMSNVGAEPHSRSTPLTGGIFDILVEVFQKRLLDRSLITPELARLSSQGPGVSSDLHGIQQAFDAAYRGREGGFKDALFEARDYLGRLLAWTWSNLSPDFLTYHTILRTLLRADREVSGGMHQDTIRECFAWREISLIPGAMVLRPHTLDQCGIGMHHASADEELHRLRAGDPPFRAVADGVLHRA